MYLLKADQQQVIAQLATIGWQINEDVLANPANAWYELGHETFFIIRLVIGNEPFTDRVIDNLLAMPWPESSKTHNIPTSRFIQWLALDDITLKARLAAWPGTPQELMVAMDQFVPLRAALEQAWAAQRPVDPTPAPVEPPVVRSSYRPDQEEIASQQELLLTHRRTLGIYLKQLGQLSEAHAPPGISHGLSEARRNIATIKQTLRSWGVETPTLPSDLG